MRIYMKSILQIIGGFLILFLGKWKNHPLMKFWGEKIIQIPQIPLQNKKDAFPLFFLYLNYYPA